MSIRTGEANIGIQINVIPAKAAIQVSVIPAKAGIQVSVIPVKTGIQSFSPTDAQEIPRPERTKFSTLRKIRNDLN